MKTGSGKVRTVSLHPGRATAGLSEEEQMAQRPFCLECEAPRTILYLEPYRRIKIRVCVNRDCWKFTNLSSFKTWKK